MSQSVQWKLSFVYLRWFLLRIRSHGIHLHFSPAFLGEYDMFVNFSIHRFQANPRWWGWFASEVFFWGKIFVWGGWCRIRWKFYYGISKQISRLNMEFQSKSSQLFGVTFLEFHVIWGGIWGIVWNLIIEFPLSIRDSQKKSIWVHTTEWFPGTEAKHAHHNMSLPKRLQKSILRKRTLYTRNYETKMWTLELSTNPNS